MFLGSRQQIEDAFQRAGWSQAAKLTDQSKLETFRAMAEMRGYQEAPVSVLLLEGRPPDLVFEKINDTFAARHHLRMWQRPGRFDGQDIWVCAATHDTGISFSDENRTFIHKIDPQIDLERAKVVNDLLLTALVRGLSLVDRSALPQNMSECHRRRVEGGWQHGRRWVLAGLLYNWARLKKTQNFSQVTTIFSPASLSWSW